MTVAVSTPAVGVGVTETHWQPRGALSFEQWQAAGQGLLRIGRAWHWWLGDHILYGMTHFGLDVPAAVELFGFDHSTISNAVRVARAFPPERRRPVLTWSHHLQVAALDVEDQERLLDASEVEGMTAARLRARICKERVDAQTVADPGVGLPQGPEAADSNVEGRVVGALVPADAADAVEATGTPGRPTTLDNVQGFPSGNSPVETYSALVRVTSWGSTRELADRRQRKVRQHLETLGVEPVDAGPGEWEAAGLPVGTPERPANGSAVVQFGPGRPGSVSDDTEPRRSGQPS